jgi:hypothetical protein
VEIDAPDPSIPFDKSSNQSPRSKIQRTLEKEREERRRQSEVDTWHVDGEGVAALEIMARCFRRSLVAMEYTMVFRLTRRRR